MPQPRLNPKISKTVARPSKKSGSKARAAADRSVEQHDTAERDSDVILSPDGRPLTRIRVAVSELVPTGDYANVTIGPVEAIAHVDLDDDAPLTENQLAKMAQVANQMAETLSGDVVSVQRNIVQENLQEQAGA